MKDILHDIITNKRIEVEQQKQAIPLQSLLAMGSERLDRTPHSMRAALAASPSGIIAEFKRKSPSKGWLHPDAKVSDIVTEYEKNGASACSILTDSKFFGGSLSDLQQARRHVNLPLLRKDFIIDPYQLYQARVMGADAILLIAAALSVEECRQLAETAHSLQLEVLLEIHTENELEHVNDCIDMLGVNNRNLGSFHTDIENSFRLASGMLAKAKTESSSLLLVSESGISDPATIIRLREAGFQGFLIGETFMKTEQPGETLAQFIGGLS
ncbi:indole-3-glycerol phosphate synthase TrpC [Parabacteroides bouchesdurhonensis]|uniref:indole-3-glycerol phosphate synthase TrpC n=1 Tax=Parabacteroides bouchesdurhonensis TaxID=1936995 RepID=UPI000C843840|nr:indole-3-glycerol phosphate synthase TrpC [Parabacteroides bouchesdurhonensis]